MIDTEEKFVAAVKAAVLGLVPNNISYDLLRRFKFELVCVSIAHYLCIIIMYQVDRKLFCRRKARRGWFW